MMITIDVGFLELTHGQLCGLEHPGMFCPIVSCPIVSCHLADVLQFQQGEVFSAFSFNILNFFDITDMFQMCCLFWSLISFSTICISTDLTRKAIISDWYRYPASCVCCRYDNLRCPDTALSCHALLRWKWLVGWLVGWLINQLVSQPAIWLASRKIIFNAQGHLHKFQTIDHPRRTSSQCTNSLLYSYIRTIRVITLCVRACTFSNLQFCWNSGLFLKLHFISISSTILFTQ